MINKLHRKRVEFQYIIQAERDNVKKRWYVISKTRVALQCHPLFNLDLSNPIG